MIRFFHQYGFFSFCSLLLQNLVEFFNEQGRFPIADELDFRENLTWYKPEGSQHRSVFNDFFQQPSGTLTRERSSIQFHNDDQYKLFPTLPLADLIPIVREYYTPTDEIRTIEREIEQEFNLIEYENICCLFYRGNDKITETSLSSYDEYINIGKRLRQENPNIRFLVQSDETEFIETMARTFEGIIVFNGHIRHIPRHGGSQVDKMMTPTMNYNFIKQYIAITSIMSKCKYIVTQSGNCGMWIVMMRGSAEGVYQFKDGTWHAASV
jgi:hypothetical protein